MSTLNKLPLELLLRVTAHLDTSELCSFRLTCRSIEAALFHSFSKEFFSQKQFMLSYYSLQVLSDIAKSRLGDCLEHVIIGLDHYLPNVDHHEPKSRNNVQKTRYCEGYDDQQALLDSGDAITLLSAAFAELSQKGRGLRVVGIRDYASPGRSTRDGHGAVWRSYGSATALHEAEADLESPNSDFIHYPYQVFTLRTQEFVKRAFRIVILAMAAAFSRRLPTVEDLAAMEGTAAEGPPAIEVLSHGWGYIHPSGFSIPALQKKILVPLLKRIERIFLNIDLRQQTRTRYAVTETGTAVPCPDHNVRQFLGHMSSLKHLRLNLGSGQVDEQFLHWLAKPADEMDSRAYHCMQPYPQQAYAPDGFKKHFLATQGSNNNNKWDARLPLVHRIDDILPLEAEPAALPELVELNLGFCHVSSDTLISIMRKFAPTLRKLELHRVTLVSSASGPVRCAWPAFLRGIRNILNLDLSHLMISMPMQTTPEASLGSPRLSTRVQFRSLAGDSVFNLHGPPMKRSYTGIDWKNFAKDLEKDMCIPEADSESESESEGSDEDMSDVEDDDDDDDGM